MDTGINCQPNTVAYVNHYWINQRGEEAYLISNKVRLGNGPSAINLLTYDYAYSGYANGYEDGLRIDISTDCGFSWDSIYGASGTALQTTPYVGSPWYPTCGSWSSDTVDLSSFGYNADTVMVRFVAINDYGNRFFMDNVKISGQNILSVEETENLTQLKIYPNPNNGMLHVKTNLINSEMCIFDLSGRLIQKEKIVKYYTAINVKNIKDGFYIIRIENGEVLEERKLIIRKN